MFINTHSIIFLGLAIVSCFVDVSLGAKCVDISRNCRGFVKKGYCKDTSKGKRYHRWTLRNCRLSCQACIGPTEPNDELEAVVQKIKDIYSPLYVIGNQCADYLNKCKKYSRLGYCYHPTVKKHCKVSCKLCEPERIVKTYWNCKDSDTRCKEFAFQRKCNDGINSNKSFGKRKCRFSCGYCRRPTTEKCGNPKKQKIKIVGGKAVTKGHYPWQVAIYFKDTLRCGGSLFSERYILSAAHCFTGILDQLNHLTVVLGEHDTKKFEGKEQQLNVQHVMIHEQYDDTTQENDIALMKLDGYADLSDDIDLVCLPGKNEKLEARRNCTITGWGNIYNMANQATVLQEIDVPVVDRNECEQTNVIGNLRVTDKMVCTGYSDGMHIESACKGDSGGPLSCADDKGVYKVYGIVSWGSTQCNALEHYNVFTEVSKYVPWIQRHLV